MQHDFYRPAVYCKLVAGLDADGWPVAWKSRIVSRSIMSRVFPGSVKNGIDESSVEGQANSKYGIPNFLVEYALTEAGVPVGFWRSVGNSQNGYITECFIEELAKAGGKDSFEFRRILLANAPRHRGVLELAAEKAQWAKPLPAPPTPAIPAVESFRTFLP